MRIAKEQLVTTPSTLNYLSESAYDYTKWNLGKGLIYNAGANRLYVCKQGTTALTNQIYIITVGADWDYAATSTGRLISPEITTPNASKYYRVFVNEVRYLGSSALGKPTEPYRTYALLTRGHRRWWGDELCILIN